MDQTFDAAVGELLSDELDRLERGIHGYSPFRRVCQRCRSQPCECGTSGARSRHRARENPGGFSEHRRREAFSALDAHDAATGSGDMAGADLELIEDADAAARSPLRGNVRRGGVAERRLERVFRRRGYRLARQVPVVFLDPRGTPRAGSVDVVPVSRPGGRPAPAAFENKFIDLSRYRLPTGSLDAARLRTVVSRHVAQALNYQQGLIGLNAMRRARQLPPLPARVRLIYQVPHSTPRAEAVQFQRLAVTVARPRGVAVTVFMPGSPASRAFEG